MCSAACATSVLFSRSRYTGKERDTESGNDYFGARYYASSMGRFMSPDPLYLEMNRLTDPQQLNLYAYVRNNPLSLTDPTGLDVALKCDTAANCKQATADFNSRKGAQFQVALGNDGKWHATGKVDTSKLSAGEKALYGAISDGNGHATLNISGNTGQSEFGTHSGTGVNSVDLGNTSKLDGTGNAGGLSSGDAIAHEALDAYDSLSMSADAADSAAGQFFPGLYLPSHTSVDLSGGMLSGQTADQGIVNGSGTERITMKYITPIPLADLAGKSRDAIQSAQRNAGSRVTGVIFVPPAK